MLTSVTTIVAFMANMTSSIAALRSFGIEAGIGVFCAFFLTGLWVPLTRLDIDNWLESKGRLDEEPLDVVHMIPSSWLSNLASQSARFAPVVLLASLLLTALAAPIMLSLEGDFQVEDFVEADSDLAVGVGMINDRFSDEGEPAYVLVEGNITNPMVIQAIEDVRRNMNSHGPDDPDQISRMPNGDVELLGVDLLLWYTRAAMAWNQTQFEEAGWDFGSADGGIGCETVNIPNREMDFIYVPIVDDSRCLSFLFGFMLTRGSRPAGDTLPIAQHSGRVPAGGGRPGLRQAMAYRIRRGAEVPTDCDEVRNLSPEQFSLVEPALEQLEGDLSPSRTSQQPPIASGATWRRPSSTQRIPLPGRSLPGSR